MAEINFPELEQFFAVDRKKPKQVGRQGSFMHLVSSISNVKTKWIVSTEEKAGCA